MVTTAEESISPKGNGAPVDAQKPSILGHARSPRQHAESVGVCWLARHVRATCPPLGVFRFKRAGIWCDDFDLYL